jgi:hypothetical protein
MGGTIKDGRIDDIDATMVFHTQNGSLYPLLPTNSPFQRVPQHSPNLMMTSGVALREDNEKLGRIQYC